MICFYLLMKKKYISDSKNPEYPPASRGEVYFHGYAGVWPEKDFQAAFKMLDNGKKK